MVLLTKLAWNLSVLGGGALSSLEHLLCKALFSVSAVLFLRFLNRFKVFKAGRKQPLSLNPQPTL